MLAEGERKKQKRYKKEYHISLFNKFSNTTNTVENIVELNRSSALSNLAQFNKNVKLICKLKGTNKNGLIQLLYSLGVKIHSSNFFIYEGGEVKFLKLPSLLFLSTVARLLGVPLFVLFLPDPEQIENYLTDSE